jgi:hypothetical protein
MLQKFSKRCRILLDFPFPIRSFIPLRSSSARAARIPSAQAIRARAR